MVEVITLRQFIIEKQADSPYAKGELSRLRLVYECKPMAFLVEQAGGKASNGTVRILEIAVTGLHQRSPIFIGSKLMVEKAESLLLTANALIFA
jgi:fructose-1,6-bisphosphatase I